MARWMEGKMDGLSSQLKCLDYAGRLFAHNAEQLCQWIFHNTVYSSVSQTPGRGPVPDPGINCTGPREVLLEFVILVF